MRKLMWITVGFSAICAFFAYGVFQGWVVPLVAVSCIALGFSLWRGWKQLSYVILGLLMGLGWFTLYQTVYLDPAMKQDGKIITAEVTVSDYSYETAYGQAADGHIMLDGKPYRIRIYVNDEHSLEPGDVLFGSFMLRYTAPGGREDTTHHAGKGTFLLGYQRGMAERITAQEDDTAFYPARWAQKIKERLAVVLPADVIAFAQALLLGDNSQLTYETDTDFKISGIRHIIAVSGLHVTILYALISTVSFKNRFLTALLGLPVLAIFASVAGFTPSVTRASIMIALMILAQLFNREYDSPTALSFAAFLMLIVNPLVIRDIGFQLTIGCVAGILLFSEPITNYLAGKIGSVKGKTLAARLKRWLVSSVSVTLSALSLTSPVSAVYFGAVSIVGVLTNLLSLWAVTWIFIGIILVFIVSFLSLNLAVLLGSALAWLIRYVLWISSALADFPLAAVYTASPYVIAWIVFVYLLLTVFLLSKKRYPFVLLCCGALGLFLALGTSYIEPMLDDVRMIVMDVGQGQSILLHSDGRNYLVDCGGDSDTLAADTVSEMLLSQGITRLDGIIVTHGDQDHAGAVKNLMSRIQADLLLLPATGDERITGEIAAAAQGDIVWVDQDMQIAFSNTEITVFGPIFVDKDNENSLCVLLETESCAILITGDRGELGETMLLREYDLPQVDILIAGHHGSKYSTSEALLEEVKPEVVIISAGKDNSYGHPSQELLDRVKSFGCRVYRTDLQGTIIFRR